MIETTVRPSECPPLHYSITATGSPLICQFKFMHADFPITVGISKDLLRPTVQEQRIFVLTPSTFRLSMSEKTPTKTSVCDVSGCAYAYVCVCQSICLCVCGCPWGWESARGATCVTGECFSNKCVCICEEFLWIYSVKRRKKTKL